MTTISRRALVFAGAAYAVSGCAIARDAARKSEIVAGADADGTAEDSTFSLIEVSSDNLAKIAHWPVNDPRPTPRWPGRGGGLTTQKIASGDKLSLRVWTAEETSLITRAGERYADIPISKCCPRAISRFPTSNRCMSPACRLTAPVHG